MAAWATQVIMFSLLDQAVDVLTQDFDFAVSDTASFNTAQHNTIQNQLHQSFDSFILSGLLAQYYRTADWQQELAFLADRASFTVTISNASPS